MILIFGHFKTVRVSFILLLPVSKIFFLYILWIGNGKISEDE